MRALLIAGLAVVLLAPNARAVTLTITPDQVIYQVGDRITLNVVGDAQGAEVYGVYGRILFDSNLANYLTSHQEPLTSYGIQWYAQPLSGGAGFAEAFAQLISINSYPLDGPLLASVTLVATAAGTLAFSWQKDGDFGLRFSAYDDSPTQAPGSSVVIVPELSTGTLLGLCLLATAIGRRRIRCSRVARSGSST